MIPYRYIVDANAASLHALYTGTSQGERIEDPDTGEVLNPPSYGVSQFITGHLLPLLQQHGTLPLLYVWDAKNNKEVRQAMFQGYKSSRASRSDTARKIHSDTTTMIKQLLAALGILQVSADGMEADDVIAFLCQNLKGGRVVLTRDADLWQLHDGEMVNVEFIGARPPNLAAMVKPQHVVLYKALAGDKSDDIPGIKGFGEKAWEKLVETFSEDDLSDLADILNEAYRSDMTLIAEAYPDNKQVQLIHANFDAAVACYQLAKLHPEWINDTIGGKLRELTWYKRVPTVERLNAALAEAKLLRMAHEFDDYMPVQVLLDAETLEASIDEIEEGLAESFCVPFDYESYDTLNHPGFREASKAPSGDDDDEEGAPARSGYVDVLSQKITGASFCYGKSLQTVVYLPTCHANTKNLDPEVLTGMFETIVAQAGEDKLVAHNGSFEFQVTKNNLGVDLDYIQDTAIWSSYVDEKEQKGLKHLSKRYLNYTQTTYAEVLGKRNNMSELSGEEVLSYGCDDSLCTGHLWHLFTTICEVEGSYEFVMENEFHAMNEFYHGFTKGVRVDLNALKQMQAIDLATMEQTYTALIEVLKTHCSEENPEAVQRYWEATYQEHYALLANQMQNKLDKGEELQHDWLAVALSRARNDLLQGSRFEEQREQEASIEWMPTAKRMEDISMALGLPVLNKVTMKGINEWLDANPAEMVHIEGLSHPAESEGNTFKTLLAAAMPELKARTGQAYSELVAFCEQVLSRNAPKVTVGDGLNMGSPKQMQALLYTKLGLPVRVRSKVQFDSTRYKLGLPGSPNTGKQAVALALANDVDEGSWQQKALKDFTKFKKALKREQSMWRPYPLWVHPATGNIHSSIRGCGTETRRPTASSPNLLQVAKGDRNPPHPRKVIRTLHDDYVIIDPDFNGQELRILASECKDPNMLDAYLGPVKKDLHTLITTNLIHHVMPQNPNTADVYGKMLEMGWLKQGENPEYALVNTWRKLNSDDLQQSAYEAQDLYAKYGLSYDDLTGVGNAVAYVRDKAGKPTNFLIVYGGGPQTLSQNTAMPLELTKVIIEETLSNVYPRLKPWTEEVVAFARQHGYVQTAYGNRKHISSDISSNDPARRARVERQLANHLIQGCAADMLKVVLAAVKKKKLRERFSAYLMAPVYDELVYHVHRDAAADFSMELMECMRVTPPGHAVPMVPELSIGLANWHDLIGLGGTPTVEQINKAIRGE